MSEEQLYKVVDFILNQAATDELKVVMEALKRRLSAQPGAMGLDPGKMAKALSDSINEQVDSSLDQVYESMRGYIAGLIRQEAPEISDEHLRELVETWTPDPKGQIKGRQPQAGEGSSVPADLLLVMVKQFLTYSLGVMSIREQQNLQNEIPDWQETYWKRFPAHVKKLLSLVLKGELDETVFWKRLNSELGFD